MERTKRQECYKRFIDYTKDPYSVMVEDEMEVIKKKKGGLTLKKLTDKLKQQIELEASDYEKAYLNENMLVYPKFLT